MSRSPNTLRSTRTNPIGKRNDDPVFGIYIAEVIATKDVSRTGTIKVFVPAIGKDKNTGTGYFDATWTSPFAGSTDPRQAGTEVENPQQTTSSYGLWAVPPDLGNLVLIAFGDGNTKNPLVISCLYQDKFNYMLPGNAGGKTFQAPGVNLPTMEKNKRSAETSHNNATRPIQHTLAEAITKQGLAHDPVRGAGNSSARRESPSEVFGLLTPGPRDPENFDYRLGGHSITLDDNLESRNIRIRTAQGNQLLLDDTKGIIYLINKEGKAWMELNQAGDILMYAEGSINMRAKKDFNIRADYNVNIEAGQDVNIKAAGDNVAGDYLGEGKGTGGKVQVEGKSDVSLLAEKNIYGTAYYGDINLSSSGPINATSSADVNIKAGKAMNQQSGKNFSIKSSESTLLTAGKDIVENAPQILLNSNGPDAASAEVAETAEPLTTVKLQDAPEKQAEYDTTAPAPLTTGGKRTGKTAKVATILSSMPTAEPYNGHATPDPTKDNPTAMTPNTALTSSLPDGSNGLANAAGEQIPAPANTPSGIMNGIGHTASGAANMSLPQEVANNFSPASQKQLLNAPALSAMSGAILSSIPPLRFPKPLNGAKATFVTGLGQKISEFSARAKAVAIDAQGAISDVQGTAIAALKDGINSAAQAARTPEELEKALAKAGVSVQTDGTTKIYQDAAGNRIIDFSNGLADTSAKTLLIADLNATANSIKNSIKVPISDNQMVALTSMANHVGTNNFAKSQALSELNSGNYGGVPKAMMEFTSREGVTQDDYVQRRQLEGEIFATPDGVPLPDSTSPNYAQNALNVREARDQYLGNGNT